VPHHKHGKCPISESGRENKNQNGKETSTRSILEGKQTIKSQSKAELLENTMVMKPKRAAGKHNNRI